MTIRQPIAENLISCRNILLGGRTNEHVLPCLESVLGNVDSILVASTNKIVEYCVTEVIDQIKNTDFVSGGRILNLIHNLPLNEEHERQWNIDYFLSMELSAFLEYFEEIKSARRITLYVCKQLTSQYLPNNS